MPILTLVDHVAGDVAEAADVNANYLLMENVVNALDRNNLTTRWVIGTATCRFYWAAAEAGDHTITRDVYLPVNAGTTDMVLIGFAYRNGGMGASTRKYAIEIKTQAGAVVDTPYPLTHVADTENYVDNSAFAVSGPYTITPAANKITVTWSDAAGGLGSNAGEYHEIDLYYATEIVESSEL
jgi:hypothetical protein